MKKTILAGTLALLLAACGGKTAETGTAGKEALEGKSIYDAQCVRCHGSNGKLGLSGAKDLTVTALTPAEMVNVISNGASGGMMPSYKEVLSEGEIKAVADYIETTLKN